MRDRLFYFLMSSAAIDNHYRFFMMVKFFYWFTKINLLILEKHNLPPYFTSRETIYIKLCSNVRMFVCLYHQSKEK